MPVTDYHAQIRDAVKDALKAATDALAAELDVAPLRWHLADDIDDALKQSAPIGVVCCVGPEQDRPELGTNRRDGIGYPVAVLLLGTGTTHGEKCLGPTGLTGFRRLVKVAFHHQRLADVPEVAWCEVSDSGPLVDPKTPNFQKLATALVVNAVGRFPRA